MTGGAVGWPAVPGPDRPSARVLAMEALARIEGGAYANIDLPRLLTKRGSHLEERDRGFVTELVYGVTRRRRSLAWLVGRHLRESHALQAETEDALHLGAYQLAYLRTPPHAAVSETVSLAPERTRGLVNAVLRKIAAEGPAEDRKDWPDLATELSYPDWIVRRTLADLGHEDGEAALRQMDERPSATPRSDGYTQDLSSTWVAEAVSAAPLLGEVPTDGERILDLCAAPGGKATWLAQPDRHPTASGSRPALVVGADLQRHRATLVAANANSLGISGQVAALVADGRFPPFRPGGFDRVLVDAPCSGIGVLRRRPDARWRITEDDADALPLLQRALLGAAARQTRPGGVLAYSVCTYLKPETAAIDRWLATELADHQPLPPPRGPWRPAGRGALLLPQAAGTDGMYLLLLRRPH